MRLLADENFPATSLRALRNAGHDVIAVAEVTPGATDQQVLAHAVDASALLITFDSDFGALIYGEQRPPPEGLLFFRFVPKSPDEPAKVLLDLLTRGDINLHGLFTVIGREQVRQRPLPKGAR